MTKTLNILKTERMNILSSKLIHWIFCSLIIVVFICPVVAQNNSSDSTEEISTAFNDSPEHKAIIKMLRAEGEMEILHTASSVGLMKGEDHASVGIEYLRNNETVSTEAYLFKEEGVWVGYRELPTHKDHFLVFSVLAQKYCAPQYKHLQAFMFPDDTWKNTDPEKRIINVVCSELIDQKWVDHRLTMVFEFNSELGWHITEGDLQEEAPAKPAKPAEKTTKPAVKKIAPSEDTVNKFFLSIMKGDMAAVKGGLEAGISPDIKRPRLGHSPLYAAVLAGNEKMALLFLKAGSDPNFQDEVGSTPLLRAVGNCKSVALVKALVAAGADVNAKARGGATPLSMAEIFKCTEIERILRKAGAK